MTYTLPVIITKRAGVHDRTGKTKATVNLDDRSVTVSGSEKLKKETH